MGITTLIAPNIAKYEAVPYVKKRAPPNSHPDQPASQ